MIPYAELKSTRTLDGLCLYCPEQSCDDHLLCKRHRDKHRSRNARYMRRVRGVRWSQLQLRIDE